MKTLILLVAICLFVVPQVQCEELFYYFQKMRRYTYFITDLNMFYQVQNSTCLPDIKGTVTNMNFGSWNYNEPLSDVLQYITGGEGYNTVQELAKQPDAEIRIMYFDKPLPYKEDLQTVCSSMKRYKYSFGWTLLHTINFILDKNFSEEELQEYIYFAQRMHNECDLQGFTWSFRESDVELFQRYTYRPLREPITIRYLRQFSFDYEPDADFSKLKKLSEVCRRASYYIKQTPGIVNVYDPSIIEFDDAIFRKRCYFMMELRGATSDQDYCDFINAFHSKLNEFKDYFQF